MTRATVLTTFLLAATGGLCGQDMHLQFDGNDRVVVPNSPSLNPTEITVECMASLDRLAWGGGYTSTDAQHLICKGGDVTSGCYRLYQAGTTVPGEYLFSFNIGPVGSGLKVDAFMLIDTARWYHLAGTYDGQDIILYVDGDVVASKTIGPAPVGNESPLYFSYHDVGGFTYHLTGMMDDVRIWDYARTGDEIQATMNAALTGSEPGLVGCWNFNEAVDDQNVYDLSPNANNGLLGSTAGVDPDDPARVPEPVSLALLAYGAAALIRRRR